MKYVIECHFRPNSCVFENQIGGTNLIIYFNYHCVICKSPSELRTVKWTDIGQGHITCDKNVQLSLMRPDPTGTEILLLRGNDTDEETCFSFSQIRYTTS